jgi:dTDP-glucose 4,6-dehydratase
MPAPFDLKEAPGHYVPKSVLLTGGAGFIGSNTLVHLVNRYPAIRFVCLDKVNYCASVRNFEEIKDKPNFRFVKGDITSHDLVNYIIKNEMIDTILHFAAQTHVDNSFGNSFEFTRANVFGTHVLLESAKLFKEQVRRFVHVSTDEVYGESTATSDRFTTDATLNPSNPYAATKVAAEFLVKSYRTSFGLPTIITRGNNVYGPKQYPEKLIPKFINLLANGQPCPLHGNGSNRRSFLHVDDVAHAFEIITFKGVLGEIYNIGSRFEISNKDCTKRLLQLFKLDHEESKYITYVKDRAFNDFRYHIDPSGLEKLGWAQRIDFEEGLKITKDWYMSHRDHWPDVKSALVAHPQFHEGVSEASSAATAAIAEEAAFA